jgi:hypothetical protein
MLFLTSDFGFNGSAAPLGKQPAANILATPPMNRRRSMIVLEVIGLYPYSPLVL